MLDVTAPPAPAGPAARLTPSGPGNGPAWGWLGDGRCRIPGCPAQVGRLRLMCRRHWYRVPKPLRDQVWATWRSGEGLSGPAYRQAVAQAVTAAQLPGGSS